MTSHRFRQIAAVSRLQLAVLLRKRFILVVVGLWASHVAIGLELTRAQFAGIPLLVSSLYIGDILVFGMTCGLVADDAEAGTFGFSLTHGLSRWVFFAGKLLPVVVMTLAFYIVCQILSLTFSTGRPLPRSIDLLFFTGLCAARVLVLVAVASVLAALFSNRYVVLSLSVLYAYGLPYLLHLAFARRTTGTRWLELALPWSNDFDRAFVGTWSGQLGLEEIAVASAQPLIYTALCGALAKHLLEGRDLTRSA